MSGPLVLTARLPAALFGQMEGLRRANYPPERNHVPAHVTLFHALPPSAQGEVQRLAARVCAQTPPPAAQLAGLADLGTGMAVAVHSPALAAVHADLAEALQGLLGLADQGRPRFHVTVQNKVVRSEARALQAALAGRFEGQAFAFAGLDLHAIERLPQGGATWQPVGQWTFRGR
ncbi:2'-5' RNA ligase family protein [Novosphingobium capsulatum]|uniref:2'-5' RNA ligase family protein n=1 Tax=Novosphingobium capsulatum TaxID=13688 RepID=UPI000786B512|nr:2'-5' RNA ligase family protein [Novosphingobium capsulatum]WQD92461.1 2'-5' RNA ligase family protein [Novosphingobium capsulatum]